ncbi:MAG: hypothetical protein H7A37_08100 [Chlamydiales bacterium]|nr:hypothetical protein [Chlamydiia bacterium]MCP5508242.1 hypothetical protein [Chlamydiales bacterium]
MQPVNKDMLKVRIQEALGADSASEIVVIKKHGALQGRCLIVKSVDEDKLLKHIAAGRLACLHEGELRVFHPNASMSQVDHIVFKDNPLEEKQVVVKSIENDELYEELQEIALKELHLPQKSIRISPTVNFKTHNDVQENIIQQLLFVMTIRIVQQKGSEIVLKIARMFEEARSRDRQLQKSDDIRRRVLSERIKKGLVQDEIEKRTLMYELAGRFIPVAA